VPQPTHAQLRRFCELDGWQETKSVRGKVPDHYRYRKTLADGTLLRTKVSHGSGSVEDPGLWAHIWKRQLGLQSEQQFWDTLKSGEPVARPGDVVAQQAPAAERLPRDLFWALVHTVGLSEQEAAGLSKQEAVARMTEYWARPTD